MQSCLLNHRSCTGGKRLFVLRCYLVSILVAAIAVASLPARGATQVLFEGFEGAFPGAWSVGDMNGADTPAFWDDVDLAFGGEAAHSGSWKGYCAGTGFAGTAGTPLYQNNMQAFMQRSVDLSAYAAAQLSFWQKLPTIEPGFDHCKVFVDGALVYSNSIVVSSWSQVVLNVGAGGVRTIRFEFISDVSVQNEGWYLDDIEVMGTLGPPNDHFADAQTLVGLSGSVNSVTTDATKEAGEPNHAGNGGGASVWYQWTSTQNGAVTFNTFGSSFDTLLGVYFGSDISNLSTVASNDDFAPPANRASSVTFQAAAGRTYRIAVDGFGGASGGFRLNWQFVTVSETILAVNITNYATVVIDSDAGNPGAGYDRDAIRVQSEVRSANSSSVDHFTTYALQYRLLDPDGVPHPIFDSTGVTNPGYTFNWTNVLSIPSIGTITNTNVVAIRPAARLKPFVLYRLELQIHRYGNFAGQSHLDSPRGYYHFTNLVSGDAALNVIAQETLTAWTRIYAVKTAPGKQHFLADANYALLRYDNFAVPSAPAPVSVALNYQLIDASDGSSIPLQQSQVTFIESMPSFAVSPSGVLVPAIQFYTHTLAIEPTAGVQLDAVSKLYRVAVTISHINQSGQPLVTGNTLASSDQRLLHFNGHLFFGGIDTVFTSLANDPPITSVTPSFVRSVLAVNNNSGTVVGTPGSTYGDGTPLNVVLRANGNAELTSGSVVPSSNPIGNANGVNFARGPITLSPSGGTADFFVQLPAGLGYTTDITQKYLDSVGGFAGVALNQALLPASNPVFNLPIWICEETKPIWIEVNSTTWDVSGGRFVMTPTSATEYVRRQELDQLDSAPVAADLKVKRSNEQYFRSVFRVISPQVIAAAGSDGSAQLTAEITFASGEFHAHFPYDALIRWTTGGTMTISNDVVHAPASQLNGVEPIELAYNRDCLDMDCGVPKAGAELQQFDVGGTLNFTRDGGLASQGSLVTTLPLTWGYIKDLNRYAQSTQPVQPGGFLMSGFFLAGIEPVMDDNDRPGTVLFSGVSMANPGAPERPQNTNNYSDGLGDYAGLNFRVTQHPGLKGESTLGGQPSGLYTLTSRSKYYTRWGGVSGIHEAVPGSFSSELQIYSYDINFNNFALSFLDSRNDVPGTESRTQGYVDLPVPAGVTNNFQELRFNCIGGLEDAKVPKAEATLYKHLSYWNADFITKGLKFDRKDGMQCNASTGSLVLAVQAHATHIDQPLFGELGFSPNGNIISRYDDKLDDFDSRLKLPNKFTLKGPAQEKYSVTPVADAYFNTYGLPGSPPQGFVNIIGKMDVPFFEDLQVHIHTQGKTNDVTTAGLAVKVMGGWPDKGFRRTNGDHFFNVKNFDAPNAGFPASQAAFGFSDAVSNSVYEDNPTAALYHPRALRTWLEVVDFDYSLKWNGTSRSFNSFEQTTTPLLILSVENRIKYLSAENAELVFGIQYDGLPTFNIANLAFDAVDQKTGAIQAFVDAGLGDARDKITGALKSMDAVLDTDLHGFFQTPFNDHIQPGVSNLYEELKTQYAANPANWPADVSSLANSYFTGQGYFPTRFRNLMGVPGLDQRVLSRLDADLASASNAISEVRNIITQTDLSAKLAKELVNKLASQLAGSVADKKLIDALDKSKATVAEIDFTLGELQKGIAELRSRINDASKDDLRDELLALVQSPAGTTQIQALLAAARTDVQNYLLSLNQPFGNPFVHYKREEVEGFIRQRLEDRFFASPIAASIQTVFKQRFYDLDHTTREGIDSSFQLLNTAIRDVVNEGLATLDNSVRKLLGDVDKVMGAGKINGYAHIKGDSLNKLRLDAYAQLKLTSEMEFNAFFQILELNSKGEGGVCPNVPIDATEVTFGADGSLAHWISSGVNAKVKGKFVFAGSPLKPINMSGGLELDGPQTFEAMTIKSLKASMGFGLLENYFSAATTIELGGFSGMGGVFFGQVCDLEPIKMWDEEVPEVLGDPNPTFTGIYWYQEAWIPVSEILFGIPATCFFRFDAGTGTGFFMFAEGPTFGGRMHMGASGEALCLFSIKGTVDLTGAKTANGVKMQGKGKLKAKIGKCPFCKKFSKTVKVTYENGDWDASY